jgi:hypothetical protein
MMGKLWWGLRGLRRDWLLLMMMMRRRRRRRRRRMV